jgi:hypothetical protein
MTEQQGLDSIVDDVLSARETAVSANERFLVELIDIVLLAAAERLVEAEASGPDASALFFGGAPAVRSGPKPARKLRRRSAH